MLPHRDINKANAHIEVECAYLPQPVGDKTRKRDQARQTDEQSRSVQNGHRPDRVFEAPRLLLVGVVSLRQRLGQHCGCPYNPQHKQTRRNLEIPSLYKQSTKSQRLFRYVDILWVRTRLEYGAMKEARQKPTEKLANESPKAAARWSGSTTSAIAALMTPAVLPPFGRNDGQLYEPG